jgi:hypothetical protein
MKNKENKDKIIILFRHGEKISDDYPDLSPKGIARSECLPLLFESLGKQYTPTKIYANIRGKTKISNYSTRAYDTVVPLAKKLGIEIEEFERDSQEKLEDFVHNKLLKSEYDVIVVSSSHKVIPIISSLLGHKVTVKGEEGYDKLFIWKNGEFYKQYNQGEFIGKDIKEWLKKYGDDKNKEK